jgi:hypothetical protein
VINIKKSEHTECFSCRQSGDMYDLFIGDDKRHAEITLCETCIDSFRDHLVMCKFIYLEEQKVETKNN